MAQGSRKASSGNTGSPSKGASRGGRRRLGRGLGSLIGSPAVIEPKDSSTTTESAPPISSDDLESAPPLQTLSHTELVAEPQARETALSTASTGQAVDGVQFRSIAVKAIRSNPHQPRRRFDEEHIKELAASIESSGIIQPLVVREVSDETFELIAGERRLMAAERAGLDEVPAIVRPADEQESARLALVENLQREDLNPIERALAFRSLIDLFDMSHGEVADSVGLERATVSNLLRLLELEEELQSLVETGRLTMGHARALLTVPRGTLRVTIAKQAIAEEWSVRQLEKRGRELTAGGGETARTSGEASSTASLKAAGASEGHIRNLEEQLTRHLGTRVRIHTGKKKGAGRLEISFHSLDEFDRLMMCIGFNGE